MKRKHGRALRCAAFGFTFATTAAAQSASETPDTASAAPLPVVLQIVGAACFSPAAIAHEVATRSPRITLLSSESNAVRRVLILTPRPVNAESGAVLTLDGVGAPVRRELWARTCAELIRAVGFVISVTFDPPAPPRKESAAEAASTSAPAPTPPTAARLRTPRPAHLEAVSAPARSDTPPVRTAAPRRWRVGPGVGGRAVFGLAPGPMWGVSALVDFQLYPPQSVGALLRLEGAFSASQRYQSTAGSALFQAFTGGVQLCAVWPLAGGAWLLSPCLVGRGGALLARGRATLESRTEQRPWWEIGANALLQVRISPNWTLGATVGGSRPLTPYAFQFEPDVFHRVSPWLADVGILTTTAF